MWQEIMVNKILSNRQSMVGWNLKAIEKTCYLKSILIVQLLCVKTRTHTILHNYLHLHQAKSENFKKVQINDGAQNKDDSHVAWQI